ncbi:unnamed protein product [Euphydryas editha]|uniref:WD repeat-containing protein 70 n=1 Tax=Euphydryas editha TaxID=104508 RepID=A0AAU9UDI3_EUPED|nr:unnamed protein product [Euphydryas editha]
MSKKPISFGKISFNINKTSSHDTIDASTTGFGTFGRTPIQEQKDIEEIAEDLESQHVHQVMGIKNFGKKAKNFDVEEMIRQAKIAAQEANRKKAEADVANDSEEKSDRVQNSAPDPPSPEDDSSDDELIGPPIPSSILTKDPDKDKLEDKNNKTKGNEDSYDELSGSDDEELTLENRIPNTHEVEMLHGTKAVVAVAVDPSGARLATGSIDYEVSFWDFAGNIYSHTLLHYHLKHFDCPYVYYRN